MPIDPRDLDYPAGKILDSDKNCPYCGEELKKAFNPDKNRFVYFHNPEGEGPCAEWITQAKYGDGVPLED